MAFRTFTTGEVLTAVHLNDYLMEQSVIACTSGSRPASPNHGMVIYETDTTCYRSWNTTASAWIVIMQMEPTSYTPVLTAATTNPTAGTGNVRQAEYTRLAGEIVHYHGVVKFGTSGAAAGSGSYLMSLPIAAVASFSAGVDHTGTGLIRDDSAANIVQATFYIAGATSNAAIYAADAQVTHAVPWTWANNDWLSWSIFYKVAPGS